MVQNTQSIPLNRLLLANIRTLLSRQSLTTLLRPPLPAVDISIRMERGCQQNSQRPVVQAPVVVPLDEDRRPDVEQRALVGQRGSGTPIEGGLSWFENSAFVL